MSSSGVSCNGWFWLNVCVIKIAMSGLDGCYGCLNDESAFLQCSSGLGFSFDGLILASVTGYSVSFL